MVRVGNRDLLKEGHRRSTDPRRPPGEDVGKGVGDKRGDMGTRAFCSVWL